MKFLREYEVAEQFKAIAEEAGEAFIAAPYWGNGAIEILSIHSGMPLRVICNLDQVGCNPDVIAELKAIGIKIKTHPRLHAKIYGTTRAVIVGSSNVSSNGLAIEGSAAAGWIEANLLSNDPEIVSATHRLFGDLWNSPEARKVKKADITAAKLARAKSGFFAPIFGKTLLAAYHAQPEAFANVYVAPYDSGLSSGASRLVKAVKEGAQPPENGLSSSDFKKADGYQIKGIPEGAWLLDLSCKRAGKYHGSWQATGLRLKPDGNEQEVVIALRRTVEIGGKKFPVGANEARILEANAHRILDKARGYVLPLSEVLRIIASP